MRACARSASRTGPSALLARLDRLSHEDPLTGLANRRRWDAELSPVCAEARAEATDVAVVLLDLNHFKQVNDRYGHAGGDQFGILLPRGGLERTVDLARAPRERAREL
ncbi:GGDEF domain-containing protein [Geodermatophilus sp. SYSU D00691]